MGRKRKFREESDFVSIRVPKSKKKEYRDAIKNFVEKKYASESSSNINGSKIKINRKEIDGFGKFEEFLKNISNLEKEKEDS